MTTHKSASLGGPIIPLCGRLRPRLQMVSFCLYHTPDWIHPLGSQSCGGIPPHSIDEQLRRGEK